MNSNINGLDDITNMFIDAGIIYHYNAQWGAKLSFLYEQQDAKGDGEPDLTFSGLKAGVIFSK